MRVRGLPLVLSTVLICCIAAQRLRLSTPSGADAYHERIRKVAETTPTAFGAWNGSETEVPPAAVELLKPNVLISRRFEDLHRRRAVTFLLVQTRDTRELVAHYPPVCYPGRGYKLVSTTRHSAMIEGMDAGWTDYTFVRQSFQEFSSIVASHLIVMPTGLISPDMDSMRTAAARVQDRFLGAAQIHVVVDASISDAERTEIVREMVVGHRGLIEEIRNGAATR